MGDLQEIDPLQKTVEFLKSSLVVYHIVFVNALHGIQ